MNRPDYRIPEDKTQEVFTLAAQLYAQHNQSYTVKELMDAGAEAKIPPEFIQQAIDQMELQQVPTQQPVPTHPTKRTKILLAGLATALVAFGGMFFLVKNALTNAGEKAQVETIEPLPNETQVSGTNLQGGTVKCEGLKLEGQDLRTINFRNADCTGANLAGADLSGVNLESANFSRADLKNAKLSGAKLKRGDFTEANLTGADLTGAELETANLSKTNLKDANLSNAKLNQTNLAEAELEGAKIDIMRAKKEGVNFDKATMPDGSTHP
jgi:uncharacterized protein YjbI with pentapeptide repeats